MDKPSQQEHWRAALESLPEYQNLHADKIPSFFFPHGRQ